MSLTAREAALCLGVKQDSIRQMVRRGQLTPLPESTPRLYRFDMLEVEVLAAQRMSAKDHARLDALWESVRRAA